MGKQKNKRERKRDERDRQKAEDEAESEAFRARRGKFRIAALIIPILALAGALTAYFYGENRQLAGLLGMIGLAIWIPLMLGSIGSDVAPRDRNRAGSIDFGNRR